MRLYEIALLGPVIVSAICYIVTAALVRAWIGGKESTGAPVGNLPPATFFRPIKRGVPGLREKLEMLVNASSPDDQINLAVDAGDDAGQCSVRCPQRIGLSLGESSEDSARCSESDSEICRAVQRD